MIFHSGVKRVCDKDLTIRSKRLQKAIAVYFKFHADGCPRGVDVNAMKQEICDASREAGFGTTIVPGVVLIKSKTKLREFSTDNPTGINNSCFREERKGKQKRAVKQ